MTALRLDYPFHIGAAERTAAADHRDYVRDLIEQVLFTAPGERVNRPDFGSGVMQLVFGPAGAETAATVEFLVKGALQQFLPSVITVEAVDATAEDAVLSVRVDYVILDLGERVRTVFVREGGGL